MKKLFLLVVIGASCLFAHTYECSIDCSHYKASYHKLDGSVDIHVEADSIQHANYKARNQSDADKICQDHNYYGMYHYESSYNMLHSINCRR